MEITPVLLSIIAITPALISSLTTFISNNMTKKDIRLDLMRLQILSKELPLDDRLKIYDEYKKSGGNSWLEVYVSTILLPEAKKQAESQKQASYGRRFDDNKKEERKQ